MIDAAPLVLGTTVAHALNLRAGWALVLLGLLSGALLGLRFHEEGFLGGYASLRRRLLRLGHIAMIALGALNVLFALSPCDGAASAGDGLCGALLLAGAVTMPVVCALVALRPSLRPLFGLPVTALAVGVALILFVHLP